MEIILFPKKYLDNRDFKEYLDCVRRIAVFDKEKKKWIVDISVIRKNCSSLKELLDILEKLKKYVDLNNKKKMIIELYKASGENRVFLDMTNLSFKLPFKIDRELFKEICRYAVYNEGIFYLKNPDYLNILKNIFSKHGINLIFEEKIFRNRCILYREKGRLVLFFSYNDSKLVEKLRKICTISYFIEKPIFDKEGNFSEIRIIRKNLSLFKYSYVERKGYTSVAMLSKVLDLLRDRNINVKINIVVKPDVKYHFSQNFKLYPHQKAAFNLWFREKRGTIAIFTRGGKSFIAMKAIATLKKPTIILVTTRELMHTWKTYLKEYLSLKEYQIGILGEGKIDIRPITVAIYNSCVKHIDKIREKFEFAVFDECHHVPANTFKEVAINIDSLYRMGLSATPTRRDQNHILLYEIVGPLLIDINYASLVRMKIVAPIKTFETFFVENREKKLEKLLEILEKYKDEKCMIFTQYVSTAEEIYRILIEKGFRATLITGSTKFSRRKFAFRDFLSGYVNIIVTTTVLDEGITVPDAEVAIIYEGSGEARQMIQRIGRVIGYMPGKSAKVYEIIDMSNIQEKKAYFRRKWIKRLYIVKDKTSFSEKYEYQDKL